MAILSINSGVAYGYVGNSASMPALQRMGFEVWRIDTVSFSNHPAHGSFAGLVRDPAELAGLVEGLDKLGVLGRCEAVLSGYLGDAGTGEVVADAVRRARAANPSALYLCDPVIGDHGRVYVRDGVPDAVRDLLLPLADIATPNAFELEFLTGEGDTLAAARALTVERGLATVASGLGSGETIECLVVEPDGSVRRPTSPRLASPYSGTGDLFAALLLGWRLRTGDLADATARAMAGVSAAIAATAALPDGTSRRDLALVAVMDQIVAR